MIYHSLYILGEKRLVDESPERLPSWGMMTLETLEIFAVPRKDFAIDGIYRIFKKSVNSSFSSSLRQNNVCIEFETRPATIVLSLAAPFANNSS